MPDAQGPVAGMIEQLSADRAKRADTEVEAVLEEFATELDKLQGALDGLDLDELREAAKHVATCGGDPAKLWALGEPAREALAQAAGDMGFDEESATERLANVLDMKAEQLVPSPGGGTSRGMRSTSSVYDQLDAGAPPKE